MGGYWIDSPDNPFNQMSYTRGGGGYDNRDTHESNDRRAHAMEGAGAAALPHFANAGVAQAYYPGKGLAVVDGNVIRTAGPGSPRQSTVGGSGGSGAGSAGVATGPQGGGTGAGSRLVLSGGLPKTTPIFVDGVEWSRNVGTTDGAEFEDRYGEFVGGVLGIVPAVADALQYFQDRSDQYRAERGLGRGLEGGGGWDMLVTKWGQLNSARLDSAGNVVMTGGGF